MTNRPSRMLARWVSGRPRQVLAVMAALTLIFGFLARTVRLDNNFAQLFSTDSEEARFRDEYRTTFGPDDGMLIAVLRADEASEALYRLVARASDRIAAEMDELGTVDSVSTVPVLQPGAPEPLAPAFSTATAGVALDERIALAAGSDLGASALISEDGRTTLVVGELTAEYDSYESVTGPAERFRSLVDSEVERARAAGLDVEVHYAGVTYTRIAAIGQMQGDLLKLFPVATLAMIALLWTFFRRPAAIVGPLLAIGSSTIFTAGIIGWAGDDLNQITVIYPVLLMGVVVATATHLVHRFYRERAAGADAPTAARVTLERITLAATVCTVTNAVGFASLATGRMKILHEFGFYLACGIAFCFMATSTIVPALLVLRDSSPPPRYFDEGRDLRTAGPTLTRRFATAITAPGLSRATIVVGVALVGVSIAIATTARFDDSLSDMLNADHPVSIGNGIIDEEMSGIVPIEISIDGPAGSFDEASNLARLDEFDRWLRRNEDLRSLGLPALFRAAQSVVRAPDPLPVDDAGVADGYALIRSSTDRDVLGALVTPDGARTRLSSLHPDTGARDIVDTARRIEDHAATAFAGADLTVRVTGEAPVAYAGMIDLTRELVFSTLVALALIVVAFGLAFRSVALALVAILPNIVPIVVGLAVYRLAVPRISPVPAVVFCVAIGLAADDTVHLMNRFRELRPSYPTSRDALIEALTTVRRAMVSSSAVLIAAFLALGISNFPANRTLGLLGSMVLTLALVADLTFGTAALAILGRRRDRQARELTGRGRRGHGVTEPDGDPSAHAATSDADRALVGVGDGRLELPTSAV